MSDDDARRYVESMRRQEHSDKEIRQSLQEAGWNNRSIDDLLPTVERKRASFGDVALAVLIPPIGMLLGVITVGREYRRGGVMIAVSLGAGIGWMFIIVTAHLVAELASLESIGFTIVGLVWGLLATGAVVKVVRDSRAQRETGEGQQRKFACPECGETVYSGDSDCPSCGAALDAGPLAASAGGATPKTEARTRDARASLWASWRSWLLILPLVGGVWQLFWCFYSVATNTAMKIALVEDTGIIAMPVWSTEGSSAQPWSGEWWMALVMGLVWGSMSVVLLLIVHRRTKGGEQAPPEPPVAEDPEPTTQPEPATQPEPPTHPDYTDEEMAEFRQKWRIRKIMIGIARLVTGTWVLPVLVLGWLAEEKGQLPAGLLERLPPGLAERLSEPLDIALWFLGGWLLLVLIVATVLWYFNSRCPACGRRIIGPAWRIPSACPRCGVELGGAKRHKRGGSP